MSNGAIIHFASISVDRWKRNSVGVRYYFLSHMHADHTKGLTPSWPHLIYCSAVSGQLLVDKFNISRSLVRELPLGKAVFLQGNGKCAHLTVTALDANHCVGAVMFLFEGSFGAILYTGDFRYSRVVHGPLHQVLRGEQHVDFLYLDNTYCRPRCSFPPREEAADLIVDIIRQHPQHRVKIILHSLGKEELLVAIAQELRLRIVVCPQRMRLLKILEFPDVFSEDVDASHVEAISLHNVGLVEQRLLEWNEDDGPTIAIRPTAFFTDRAAPAIPGFFVVPYSDHSSFEELCEFVSLIKPNQVVPLVTALGTGYDCYEAARDIQYLREACGMHFTWEAKDSPSLTHNVPPKQQSSSSSASVSKPNIPTDQKDPPPSNHQPCLASLIAMQNGFKRRTRLDARLAKRKKHMVEYEEDDTNERDKEACDVRSTKETGAASSLCKAEERYETGRSSSSCNKSSSVVPSSCREVASKSCWDRGLLDRLLGQTDVVKQLPLCKAHRRTHAKQTQASLVDMWAQPP